MKHYLHHIPGRIRVNSLMVKRNHNLAEEVQTILNPIEGVNSVLINPVTGSILIEYSAETVAASTILNVLKKAGHIDLSKTVTNDQYIQAKVSKTARIFWSAVSGAFVETALAGTGLSFLAFLL
jgi:copper chaperone CopZ